LFDWLRKRFSSPGKGFSSWVRDAWVMPNKDTQTLLKEYEISPWLRATTGRTAKDVGTTTWRVYKAMSGDTQVLPTRQIKSAANLGKGVIGINGQRNKLLDQALENKQVVELVDHPLLSLLDRPGKELNGMQLMMVTQAGLSLTGEYFWWAVPGKKSGQPAELMPIPPHWVQRLPTKEDPKFVCRHHKWHKDIPIDQMVWFKHPKPLHPFERGTGIGTAVGAEVDMDRAASDHILAFFRSGGLPDILIGVDGANESELEKAKRKFMSSYNDAGTAHGVHFYSGQIDVKSLSPTFKENQMIEVRNSARDGVLRVHGHPPEIHGILENSNRSTIDAAYYLYAMLVLLPDLQLIARCIQHQLMPMFLGGDALVFAFDSPVPEDKELQIEVLKYTPTVFQVDEIRALAGFPPLPNNEGQVLYEPPQASAGTDMGGSATGGSKSSKQQDSYDPDMVEFSREILNVPSRTH
jgi:Phage portal protein